MRVVLGRIPVNGPVPGDFRIDSDVAGVELGLNQVRVQTRLLGLNAGLRARLGTGASTTLGPAIGIGDTPQSDGIGQVVESRHSEFALGDLVVGLMPWATSSVVAGTGLRRVDPASDPLRELTILGHVGLTAYAGLASVGGLQPGETVWISAAAGGVGSCAVQIADRLGAKVIASAAGRERLQFLRRDLGIEDVMDRRLDLESQLSERAPEGIDLYFDSVGGDHLRLALGAMREQGRIVLVGGAGGRANGPLLKDTSVLIRKRLRMIGFSVTDHHEARPQLESLVRHTDLDRPMVGVATVRQGITSIPEAFCELLAGRHLGRVVVEVADEAAAGR